MAKITQQLVHENGIPLGGIGTGSIEIRPDGYFHEWQICNMGQWAPNQPACCASTTVKPLPVDTLVFHLRTQQAQRLPLMRRLGIRGDQHDLYAKTWLKSVQAIEFTGRYPMTTLQYVDHALPVQVTASMFSPIIPHDARTSGTPGCHIVFSVQNTTKEPVSVSLLGVLKNPVAGGAKERKLRNAVAHEGDTTYLTMRTSGDPQCLSTAGSMGFSVTGGERGWVLGEYPGWLSHYTLWGTGYGFPVESVFNLFRATGRLTNLDGDTSPAGLARFTGEELAALSDQDIEAVLAELKRYPFAAGLWGHICEIDAGILSTRSGKLTFLAEIARRLDMFDGADRSLQNWGGRRLEQYRDRAARRNKGDSICVKLVLPESLQRQWAKLRPHVRKLVSRCRASESLPGVAVWRSSAGNSAVCRCSVRYHL